MNAVDHLSQQIERMDAALASGDDLDVGSLTQACQDLVAWASRFDGDVTGGAPPSPTGDDLEGLRRAREVLGAAMERVAAAQTAVRERMRTGQDARRALGGYAFLKPLGRSSQYVDFKA